MHVASQVSSLSVRVNASVSMFEIVFYLVVYGMHYCFGLRGGGGVMSEGKMICLEKMLLNTNDPLP